MGSVSFRQERVRATSVMTKATRCTLRMVLIYPDSGDDCDGGPTPAGRRVPDDSRGTSFPRRPRHDGAGARVRVAAVRDLRDPAAPERPALPGSVRQAMARRAGRGAARAQGQLEPRAP